MVLMVLDDLQNLSASGSKMFGSSLFSFFEIMLFI